MSSALFFIDYYNGLLFRQRIVLFLAFLSGLYCFWYFLFLLPFSNSNNELKKENSYLSSLYEESREVEEIRAREGKSLGVISLNNKLNYLKGEVNNLNLELKKYFSIMNSRNDLMSIVKDLVDTAEGISLKQIELLPVETIVVGTHGSSRFDTGLPDNVHADENDSIESEPELDDIVMYKHKVYVRLEGGYIGLTQYLKQIESLEWGLFIQDIHYKIDKYPNANVSLMLYSLSLGNVNKFNVIPVDNDEKYIGGDVSSRNAHRETVSANDG